MNFNQYYRAYFALRDEMTDEGKAHFDARMSERILVPMHLYAFSVWLGALGIDRFVLGHWGRGLGKLLTLGGFGIWQLIDLFLIGSGTRRRNHALAQGIVADMHALEAESEGEDAIENDADTDNAKTREAGDE